MQNCYKNSNCCAKCYLDYLVVVNLIAYHVSEFTYRPRILLTQPLLTWRILLISQGRAPEWANSTIFLRVDSGRGRPLTNTPPSWFTPLCPIRNRRDRVMWGSAVSHTTSSYAWLWITSDRKVTQKLQQTLLVIYWQQLDYKLLKNSFYCFCSIMQWNPLIFCRHLSSIGAARYPPPYELWFAC